MSAKQNHVRLGHILFEIDGVTKATQGMTPAAIIESYGALRTVERALQIISEAAKELDAAVHAEEPDVPWAKIIGIGNLLRHEYYKIKADQIYTILSQYLPQLRPAVVRLLEKHTP
jgi:uncharacterized protein with HEPN domain